MLPFVICLCSFRCLVSFWCKWNMLIGGLGFEWEQQKPRSKPKAELEILELRRSSRVARNPVPIYREVDTEPSQYFQRRSSRRHTVSSASHKERLYAIETAEKFMNDLKSGHPAFVKSMLRSHVSGCFWLGLPSVFCKKYLPSQDLRMVLEDEQGLEYDSLYIASRTGLSAGWRGFSLDHDVDDGDALVFELSEPARFKIYIIKALIDSNSNNGEETAGPKKKTGRNLTTSSTMLEDTVSRKIRREEDASKRAERAAKRHMHD
ncbi:B3 domain-containing protein Os05g0481400-like isoform X2 [Nymphaea colorata]|uniref:B3 domain-containing protein Os05g0481400-like isoform X2 n=1 Tax=Nymphaea colorata TaxID=210225 RepID=UPI00129D7B29|nr:B3 domain-containing protein Os05g0481400-like isoform X2 [Nymphaea colorata]